MRKNPAWPGLFPGLILVSLGGGLLAREFGLLPPNVRFVDFWPLLPVFIGIASLFHRRNASGVLISLAFIVFGGVMLAGNLGFIAFPAARLWPGLLVLLGIAFLVRGRRGPLHHGPPWDPSGRGRPGRPPGEGWTGPTHQSLSTSEDRLAKQITFSGAEYKIESQAWKGGELGVTGGGVELDLRNAALHPDGALLDVRVLMGGVDIRVPDTWQVVSDMTPLFGGADDMTRSAQGAAGAPRLRVTGTVTLGGVTIRN